VADSLIETVANFFINDGWPFTQVGDQPILRLQFQGESGRWLCIARTQEEHGQFMFYSVCPMVAPEERRMAVAEFITRANYGLILGNFEMDFDDGEIRFKTSADVSAGATFDAPLLRQLVYTNVLVLDKFFPALAKIIYGNVEPGTAFREVNLF
jgi:hypothetical protein